MPFLTVLIGILLEQVLVLSCHARSINWEVNSDWKKGDKVVVLIPGYGGNYIFFEKLGNYMNGKGYRIVTPDVFDGYGTIDSQASKFADIISKSDHEVVIIGHSRGALVGKIVMDNYPEANKKIEKLISISAPWQGSLIGYLPFLNLNELRPDSVVIGKLNEAKDNWDKIVGYKAKYDDRVIPNSGLEIDRLDIKTIEVVGHSRILFDDQLLKDLEGVI